MSFDLEQTTILTASISFNIPDKNKKAYGELFKNLSKVVSDEDGDFGDLSEHLMSLGKKLAGRGKSASSTKTESKPKKKRGRPAKKKAEPSTEAAAPRRRIRITAEEDADLALSEERETLVDDSEDDVDIIASDEYDEYDEFQDDA